jgi:hypothetical protein
MHIEVKRQAIYQKMAELKGAKRDKFREFLVNDFNDDDFKDLSNSNADKLLAFLASL